MNKTEIPGLQWWGRGQTGDYNDKEIHYSSTLMMVSVRENMKVEQGRGVGNAGLKWGQLQYQILFKQLFKVTISSKERNKQDKHNLIKMLFLPITKMP